MTSTKNKFSEPEGLYFISPSVISWIDLFTYKRYSEIILESLNYCCRNKGLKVHAYCITSNQVHLIVSSREADLSRIIRDFKLFTNKRLIEQLEKSKDQRKDWMLNMFKTASGEEKKSAGYNIWQRAGKPLLLDTVESQTDRLNYVHLTPVNNGMVTEPEAYLLSSARAYSGRQGLMELELLPS